MTMLVDDESPQSGTHVLLIGVGDYPFLKDGSVPAEKRFQQNMGMGQLSSPPKSVEELAKWFSDGQNGFHNPQRPCARCKCSAPRRRPSCGARRVRPTNRSRRPGLPT